MGILPVKSKTFKESPKILGIANAFSGGVFLAIGLTHIMPEEVNAWNELHEGEKTFPWPYLILVLGYTLMLTIDKVVFDAHEILDGHGHGHGQGSLTMSFLSKDPNLAKA
jgi:zinc transporter 1/2/3